MKKLIAIATIMILVSPVLADWDEGDGHKMHWPQLPDPNGWDVAATPTGPVGTPPIIRHVADDWKCSETGPVLDIHFWGSWKNGIKGNIEAFMLEIWADDPVGPGGYFPDNTFSTPLYRFTDEHYEPDDPKNGEPGIYWYYGAYLGGGEVTERWYGSGDQGWYDPHDGTALPNDHMDIYQYNVDMRNLPNVFHQEEGTIYWLQITAILDETTSPPGAEWGWKTSGSDHFMDDAVYFDSLTTVPDGSHQGWNDLPDYLELRDPRDQEISLDMAFVITPEPATMSLLVVGGLALLRRRRK